MNKITVNLTEAEHYHSSLLHGKFYPFQTGIGIAMLVWLLYSTYDTGAISTKAMIISAIGLALLYLYYLYSYLVKLRFRCRKMRKQNKMCRTPTDISWDDEYIYFEQEHFYAKLKWSDFAKYKEDKKIFLLYQSDTQCSCIPKSAFDSSELLTDFSKKIKTISG